MDSKNKEHDYLENARSITIALLATGIAIMSNLLQVSDVDCDMNLQTAVTILSISIPYFIWDIYFLNLENPDGEFEPKFFTFLRVIFWITGAVGIGFAFNYLPNNTVVNTLTIFIAAFVFFFMLKFYPVIKFFYENRRRNKENK